MFRIQKIYNLITRQSIPFVCTGIHSTMLDVLLRSKTRTNLDICLDLHSISIEKLQEDPKGGKPNST